MKINYNNLSCLLAIIPFLLPNKPILLILSLPAFLMLLHRTTYTFYVGLTLSCILGGLFFVRDLGIGIVDFANFKLIYLLAVLLIAKHATEKNLVSNECMLIFFKAYAIINFLCLILQLLIPSLPLWQYLADNEGQYASMLNGRMFGLAGNPTHSGYLSLIATMALITFRANYQYILLSVISVVLILNKMSILVLIIFSGIFIFLQTKNLLKKVFLSLISITAALYICIFVLFPFIDRWAEVGYDTHTITYRTYVYTTIFQSFTIENSYIFFGLPELYQKISLDAFDSLPALFITKFGILTTALIYLTIFFLSLKNIRSFLLYFVLVIL